jgi:hypothetical protein
VVRFDLASDLDDTCHQFHVSTAGAAAASITELRFKHLYCRPTETAQSSQTWSIFTVQKIMLSSIVVEIRNTIERQTEKKLLEDEGTRYLLSFSYVFGTILMHVKAYAFYHAGSVRYRVLFLAFHASTGAHAYA